MAGRLPQRGRQQSNVPATRDNLPGDGLMEWMKSDEIQGRIAEVASKSLDEVRFLRLCHVVIYKTPKLQECSRSTILQSVIEAAARGWELGFDAHLVPYKNKGRMECQLIADYRGLKKSVMRGGQVVKMKAGVVFEGEEFTWEEGGLEERFEYKPRADIKGSEKMLFAWARAWFKDNTSQFTVVRQFEVLRSMAASRGSGSEYSPWQKFPDRMWAKTALRRLCNEIGLSDEAMAVMRDDDQRSFSFNKDEGGAPMGDPTITVVDNTPDKDDLADEAARQDAEKEAQDLEEQEPEKEPAKKPDKAPPKKQSAAAKKKAAAAKKAAEAKEPPESSQEETESGEGRETEADGQEAQGGSQEPLEDAGDLIASITKKGKQWGLTVATLVSGAESMEEKALEGGLKDAKDETLKKMNELLEGEKGAYSIEEHALSWQDRQGGDE